MEKIVSYDMNKGVFLLYRALEDSYINYYEDLPNEKIKKLYYDLKHEMIKYLERKYPIAPNDNYDSLSTRIYEKYKNNKYYLDEHIFILYYGIFSLYENSFNHFPTEDVKKKIEDLLDILYEYIYKDIPKEELAKTELWEEAIFEYKSR